MTPSIFNPGYSQFYSLKLVTFFACFITTYLLQYFSIDTNASLFALLWHPVAFGLIFTLTTSWFGQLGPIRIVPRKSDIFINACIGACVGAALSLQTNTISYALIGATSGFLCFIVHKALSEVLKNYGKRKLIIIDLEAKERASILKEFSAQGLLFYFEIGDRKKLEQAIDNDKVSSIALVLVDENSLASITYDQYLFRARLAGIPLFRYQHVLAMLSTRIDLRFITAWSLLEGGNLGSKITPYYQKCKSIVEPVIALLLAVVLSPITLLVMIMIKLTSKGPILYSQKRLGTAGSPFILYKFRSMTVDAEKDGAVWATKHDSRVTNIGKILRRTRLDEIPQLINIFKGDMGFIGPRPERPEFYETITEEVPLFPMRLLIKPGLTGWAQVTTGYTNTIEGAKRKLEHDLYYLLYASIRLDLIIVLTTVFRCFSGDSENTSLDASAKNINELTREQSEDLTKTLTARR